MGAAVSTKDNKERIVTGKDIPKDFLDNAKRIGREAIKVLPDLKLPNGESVKNVLGRTDIGCSDSQIHDRNTHWNPKKKTFFLNEIEPSSTTYFVRWLKHDCIPVYGKLYAQKAPEIYKKQQTRRKIAKAASKKVSKGTKPTRTTPMKVLKAMKLKAKK